MSDRRVGEHLGAVRVYAQHMHTEPGLWCDDCALPSVIRVDHVLTMGKGRPMLVSRAVCRECGRRVR